MIVVQYILPSLRGAIASRLIDELGLSKSEAAMKMDVTPAAITQYLNKSRGNMSADVMKNSDRVGKMISDIAIDLAKNETPSDIQLLKLCRACKAIRTEGLICELHKEAMPSLKELEVCTCSIGLGEMNE
jgi:predicted transcriptional regulator